MNEYEPDSYESDDHNFWWNTRVRIRQWFTQLTCRHLGDTNKSKQEESRFDGKEYVLVSSREVTSCARCGKVLRVRAA